MLDQKSASREPVLVRVVAASVGFGVSAAGARSIPASSSTTFDGTLHVVVDEQPSSNDFSGSWGGFHTTATLDITFKQYEDDGP